MVDLKKLKNAVETGRVELGYNKTVKSVLMSTPKAVVLSGDIPKDMRQSIEYYCWLVSVPLIVAKENGLDLGSSLGRSHTITSLSILDEGDSSIVEAQ
ncbi:MAG: 50S ribosomal protein L30e [Candidatus Altiarchaeota archaeon]|nr:50S ribosomal protein L30e [Candidatus Altiarchaeota archaeon]